MFYSHWMGIVRRRLQPPKARRSRSRGGLRQIDALESRVLLSATAFDSGSTSLQSDVASTSASLTELSLLANAVWISPEEILQLPTSGAAWNTIATAASGSTGTPDLSSYDSNADVLTLAKAIVGVRLGNEQYKAQVRTNVMAAMGTEEGGPQVTLSRGIAPYLISAGLVGLSPEQDAIFRSWLVRKLTTDLHSPGYTVQTYHETRPNNHGLMAGASRAAIAVYLNDAQELARVAQVFKGWLGDRSSYAGFDYGDLSWQSDPNNPVGINPVGATIQGHDVDGVMPEELRRGASYRWPPVKTGYPWEGLQAAVVTAEILYRAGYDAWEWEDRALLRAVQWLYRNDFLPEGDDQWTPWIIDARYGTSFATNANASPGKLMGWTAWTHQFAAAVPQIQSFSPGSGTVGTTVTLAGRNFTSVTDVYFNNVRSQNLSIISDTELRAVVPSTATTGAIRVVNAEGSTTSSAAFVVLSAPAITSFTPTIGPVGTEVTINGSGFTGATAVRFNGTPSASFTILSDAQLRATVAAGTTSGTIQVVNPVNTATSSQSFVVTVSTPSQSFSATHDAHVRSDSTSSNYGTATTIRIRSSGPTYNGYLKFSVTGLAGAVQSAKVRLFVTDGSPSGGSIFAVSNNLAGSTTAWTEQNLTWNNAPPISGNALSTLGSVA
ncbi:MAG: IPT/TIG domain-containing protein, partial [Planctomycetaceae bacterium]